VTEQAADDVAGRVTNEDGKLEFVRVADDGSVEIAQAVDDHTCVVGARAFLELDTKGRDHANGSWRRESEAMLEENELRAAVGP